MVVRVRLLVVLENRLVVALHLSEDVPAILEHDSHVVQNVAARGFVVVARERISDVNGSSSRRAIVNSPEMCRIG